MIIKADVGLSVTDQQINWISSGTFVADVLDDPSDEAAMELVAEILEAIHVAIHEGRWYNVNAEA